MSEQNRVCDSGRVLPRRCDVICEDCGSKTGSWFSQDGSPQKSLCPTCSWKRKFATAKAKPEGCYCIPCPRCEGEGGWTVWREEVCDRVVELRNGVDVTCPRCNGTGRDDRDCPLHHDETKCAECRNRDELELQKLPENVLIPSEVL